MKNFIDETVNNFENKYQKNLGLSYMLFGQLIFSL